MQDPATVVLALIAVICFVFAAFFAIRGIYKFKEWQAGEKDEFWTFLAMFLGCGSLILCGVPLIGRVAKLLETTDIAGAIFIGVLLGLAAIGLTTVYYFLKWKAAK